jgi:hypothetical protein
MTETQALDLTAERYEPIGTPHNVVALSPDDLARLDRHDDDWVWVEADARRIVCRVRSHEAIDRATPGSVLLTSRLHHRLGVEWGATVKVAPYPSDTRLVAFRGASVENVDGWVVSACSPDLAPAHGRLAELTNVRTGDAAVLLLRPDHRTETSVSLSYLQRRLLALEQDDTIAVRDARLPHLEAVGLARRLRHRSLDSVRGLVGSRELPARVQRANAIDTVGELARIAEPLWVALGLQDGDRIVCEANGRRIVRRASPRPPELPEGAPAPGASIGVTTSPAASHNETQADFALWLDQPGRVDLGLDRRSGDMVRVFRDPQAAVYRSLSGGLISALLATITVGQASSILQGATGVTAGLVGAGVFYFALQAERSRVE